MGVLAGGLGVAVIRLALGWWLDRNWTVGCGLKVPILAVKHI